MQGNGVYKSTDAGKTWTHVGLEPTQSIAKIVVRPDNCDVAWVAALGVHSAPNPDRGIFKTTDGGLELAQGPLQERQGRRDRPGDGPEQPGRALRRHLGGVAQELGDVLGRPRLGAVEVHGRRRALAGHHLHARPGAGAPDREDRRGGVGCELEPRLGVGRARAGGRRLPLGRRGAHVGAHERRAQAATARLLLQPHLRRPEGREHRLRPQHGLLQVDRRREDLPDAVPRPARRQPRPVDRVERPAADDQRQRRERERLRQRRADVDRPGRADRAVLPRDHDEPRPYHDLRRAAGQLDGVHPVGRVGLQDRRERVLLRRWAAARAATSPPSRTIPTSTTRARTAGC